MIFLKRAARTLYRLCFSPYLTPRRFFNMLVIRLQEQFRCEKIWAYPEILIIEATNACDSTCKLCPVGEGRRSRPVSVLDMDTYKRFIDELAPYAQRVHFHNWGDPILDKRLVEKIRYAHEKGLVTYISTTLHHLTQARAMKLVTSGLNELSVSIHAASQGTYEKYQPGHSFDQVLNNIRMLVYAKRSTNRKEPLINLIFVRTRMNDHEVPLLPGLVESLDVDSFTVSDVSINGRFLWSDLDMKDRCLAEEDFLKEIRQRAEIWLPEDRLHTFDMSVPYAKKLASCDRLWRIGLLNSDGSIPPCCDIYRPENNFGHYQQGISFREVWNNDKFRKARRSFCKRKGSNPILVCTKCPGHGSRKKARNPIRF